MNDLRKALDKIAEGNALGKVSDSTLEKANEAYKAQTEDFLEDYEYHVYVSKSIFDHLNNIEPDEEIQKAVLPGQTKVIDGIMYIYTATPGAKTKYDWRVFQGNKKVGRQPTSKSGFVNKTAHVNSLFPSDFGDFIPIKQLGGSTGAMLVRDKQGNDYVMKRGNNTSNDHVKNEYLTNQLYDLLGLRVPDYELYEVNGEAVLVSKFIPMTKIPSSVNYPEMAKGYIADALLANWDVYQNDNCLIDSAGRVVRVDNGGSLTFRAQGGVKTFGHNVDEIDSLYKYNTSVLSNLSEQEILDQYEAVIGKQDDVLNYLEESGTDPSLITTFEKRFKDLVKRRDSLINSMNKKTGKIKPRKLKSQADMYKVFTEDEIKDFWLNAPGTTYYSKLTDTGKNGWELLNAICEERGFNARPLVVSEDEYWKGVVNSKYQLFRGLDSSHSKKASEFADEFRYDDSCFYGTVGVYSSGIYFHVNDGNKNKDATKDSYKNSDAYKAARNYAGRNGEILDCYLDPSAKVATVDDLEKEILSTITVDPVLSDALKTEIENLTKTLETQEDELQNVSKNTADKVKQDMHWDEDTLVMHQLEIDAVDWGALDDDFKPDYPSFDTFVKGKVFDWVTKNGGTVTERGQGTDVFTFKLPNSKEPFLLTRYQYENNAIKQKNAFSKAYNYPIQRFSDWLMKEHYGVINKTIEKEIEAIGNIVNDLKADIKVTKTDLNAKVQELKDMKKPTNPDGNFLSGVYSYTDRGSKEAIGTYAALKGYDAVIQSNGNGGPNSFMIVLNRSKVIVKR